MGAGSLDLGNLYGKLIIDYSELPKAELAAANFAKNTKNYLSKAADGFKTVGKNLSTYVTLPVLAAGAASFEAARQFSISFADVQKNIGDLDANNIEQFRNTVLDIGRNSLIGANGVAALASEGGKLGDNAKGALEFAKAAEKMAVAFDFGKTKEAAAEAGEIIGKLRSQFHLTTDEVLGMGDAINYFADNTSGSVKGILDIIVKQGSTIKTATNLTNAQIVSLATTFEQVSPNADIAATAMKNFALSLTMGEATTKKASGAFNDIGLDAVKMSKLMKKDAVRGINAVLKGIGKLDDYKRAGIIATLFGKESIGPIAAIVNDSKLLNDNFAIAADSAKFLDSLTKEWQRAMGTDDNKMALAISALNVAMIQIGQVIVPIVADIATAFSVWLTSIGNLDPAMVKLGIVIAGVAAAAGPLLIGLGSILSLLASSGGLTAAFASLGTVAVPVIAALVAIGGAAYLIYKNWGSVSSFLTKTVSDISEGFNKFKTENQADIESMNQSWIGLGNTLMQSGSGILQALANINEAFNASTDENKMFATSWQEFFQGITNGADWLAKELDIFFSDLNNLFSEWSKGLEQVPAAFDAINDTLNGWVSDIKGQVNLIPGIFKENFEYVMTYLKRLDWNQIGSDIMEGLKNGITGATDSVIGAIKDGATGAIEAATSVLGIHSPSTVFAEIGKNLMLGLSLGITNNTGSAIAAVIAASDAVKVAGKNGMSADSMKSAVQSLNEKATLDPTFATDNKTAQFDLDIEKEKAYYAQSLDLLNQAEAAKITSIQPYHVLREQMEADHQQKLANLEKQRQDETLKGWGDFFGNMATLSKSKNKELAEIGKAAAIAQATINMYSAIASAFAKGTEIGGPYVGAAFAVAAGAAGAINIANIASQKAYNNGGHIAAGQVGLVGEKRGELVSGPANVMSAQDTHELFQGGGSSGGTNVNIKVLNFGNSKVEVSESGSDREKFIEIVIDRAKQSIAGDAIRGDGVVDKAFASSFKLPRTGT